MRGLVEAPAHGAVGAVLSPPRPLVCLHDGLPHHFGGRAVRRIRRALEVYELERIDFAEAYLVAQAEATGVHEILSFDRTIDRVASIARREP